MNRIAGVVGLMLSIAVGAVSAKTLVGVASVIDGDTIEIRGEKIRLHGIDAPESGQRCNRSDGEWACGQQAALALSDYIGRSTVSCEVTDTDKYSRLVARCSTSKGSINQWMVQSGWALAYTDYSRDYVLEEALARQSKLNLWGGTFDTPQNYRRGLKGGPGATPKVVAEHGGNPECTIKGNISSNGRIYHLPGTSSYARTIINESAGERWFCSEAEAVSAGWRRAGTRGSGSTASDSGAKAGGYQYVPPATTYGNQSGQTKSCCKYCKKGIPCGNGCISARYTCRQPPGCAC